MKKNNFIKDNKLALSILTISITATVITLVVLYIQYKKMQTAIKPLSGRITSKFGTRIHPITGKTSTHNGIDISATLSTPIVSPLDGVVSSINTHATGGKQLIIKHTNGYRTGYAHLNGYAVTSGQAVKQGQVIAYVGNTGESTAPHLHFTVTNPIGVKVNPEDYIKF